MKFPWHKEGVWPENVPYDIEVPELNVNEIFFKHIPKNEGRPYLHFLDKTYTYGEIKTEIIALASFLSKNGITSNDKIALLIPNIPQFVISFFAAQYLGCIVSPINILYVSSEIKYQLNDTGATVLISLDAFYDNAAPIIKETSVKLVITTSIGDYLPKIKAFLGKKLGKIPVPKLKHENVIFWKTAIKEGLGLSKDNHNIPEMVKKDPNDVALLIYTGGTTGVSKGAMTTHRNLLHNVEVLGYWTPEPMVPDDCFVGALPMFHSYGMTVGLLTATYHGGRLILIPNPRDTVSLLKQIEKYKATYFPGVPTLYISLLNHPLVKEKKVDLSSIKFCLSGAAPLPVELQKEFEKITGATVLEGYGLTETSPVTHANPVSNIRKVGSVGIPICNTEARIVDLETREELPIGEIGEICMRGPQIMKGYWKKPEETARVIDQDGWFYSGDIGKMDEDGFFYIVDRKKDMIIVSGYKVFPRDVEEVLFKHPAVENAAVIGVPDERTTERVKAFVVLKEGQSVTEKELLEFCSKNLAKYRVPKEIEIRKELPLSAVGKVLRRELKAEVNKK